MKKTLMVLSLISLISNTISIDIVGIAQSKQIQIEDREQTLGLNFESPKQEDIHSDLQSSKKKEKTEKNLDSEASTGSEEQNSIVSEEATGSVPEMSSIVEQNLYKLNPYLQAEEPTLNEQEFPAWINTQIQSVFYQTNNRLLTYVDKENFKEILGIQIHFNDGSTKSIKFSDTNDPNQRMIDNLSFPILQLETLPDNNDEAILLIQNELQSVTYESLLAPYGEHVTYDQLDKKFILEDMQVGEQKKIDSVQLEETLSWMKEQGKEVAQEIAHSFPELIINSLTGPDEKEKKLSFIKNNMNDLLLIYAFTHRWFDYSIGQVKISEVIFSKSSLFSINQEKSDLEMLKDLVDIMKSDSFIAQPGNPFLMTIYLDSAFFHPKSGLRSKGLGYNIKDLEDKNNRVTMGTLIEFLIRKFENTEDYAGWLEKQGFVTATEYIDDSVQIKGLNKNIWEALRTIENEKSKISPSFLTILLSIKSKESIIISNGANTISFGQVNKQLPNASNIDPKELASTYAKNNNRLMKFIWDMSDDSRKQLLQEDVSRGVGVSFDAGEIEEGKKDLFDPGNHYLHELILPVSPTVANRTTRSINGVVVQTNPKNLLIMGMNNLYSEYTVAHEETHRHKELLNGGYNQRTDIEDTASMAESDEYDEHRLNINYYYQSTYTDWNMRPPESKNELKNYAQGLLDLNMAWNIEKAKYIFSLPLAQQVGKVYKATNIIKGEFKKLSYEELSSLNIKSESKDFIERLVNEEIMLPSVPGDEQINYNLVNGAAKVPFKKDAMFNIPYTNHTNSENSFHGWNHIWHFLSMEKNGWDGYIDFLNIDNGLKDEEVLRDILSTTESPKEYWINKYKNIATAVQKNKLKLDNQEELQELISNNILDDFNVRKNFLKKYILGTDSLFEGIYETKENIPAPIVDDLKDTDTHLTGKALPKAKIIALVGGELIFKGVANNDGLFDLEIPSQANGTIVKVKQETENGISDFTKVIVGHLEKTIGSYDELIQTMLDFPGASLSLAKDLIAEGAHKDTIVPNFSGQLNGNGHKISGLTHPLINQAQNMKIASLVLDSVFIEGTGPNDSGMGAVANMAKGTSLKDVHVQGEIRAEGSVEVGGLIGIMEQSSIEESSSNISLSGRDTGGLVGRLTKNSLIKNSYSLGEITKGRRVGGLVGNGYDESSLLNTYSGVVINASGANESNGIIGTSYSGGNKTFNISNSLSVSEILNPKGYKVQKDYFSGTNKNNYELETTKGKTSTEIKELDVSSIAENRVKNSSFYKDDLTWDIEKIWDTKDIEKQYPSLRNSDPRTEAIGEEKISKLKIDFNASGEDQSNNENIVGKSSNIVLELENVGEDTSVAKNIVLDMLATQFEVISNSVKIDFISANGNVTSKSIAKEDLKKGYQFDDIPKGSKIKIYYEGVPWNNSNENSNKESKLYFTYNDGKEDKAVVKLEKTIKVNSGYFGFATVPEQLSFKTMPISVNLNSKIIDREDSSWAIRLNDFRGTNSSSGKDYPDRQNWQISATSKSFRDGDGNGVPTSVMSMVYIEGNKIIDLGDEEVLIERHNVKGETPYDDHDIEVLWKENEGIKAIVHDKNGIRAKTKYEAELNFELRLEP